MVRESVGSILPEACFKKEGDPFKGLLKDFACISCGVTPSYVVMQNASTTTPIGPEIRAERQAEAAATAESTELAEDTSADSSNETSTIEDEPGLDNEKRRL